MGDELSHRVSRHTQSTPLYAKGSWCRPPAAGGPAYMARLGPGAGTERLTLSGQHAHTEWQCDWCRAHQSDKRGAGVGGHGARAMWRDGAGKVDNSPLLGVVECIRAQKSGRAARGARNIAHRLSPPHAARGGRQVWSSLGAAEVEIRKSAEIGPEVPGWCRGVTRSTRALCMSILSYFRQSRPHDPP